MPRGRYSLHDPHDGRPLGDEVFACAPGPAGWRYTATTRDADGAVTGGVDVTLDSRGRPARVEVTSGGWRVRGGAAVVDGAAGLLWLRAPEDPSAPAPVAEDGAPALTFTGRSPVFWVAAARVLALAPGDTVRVRMVELAHPVLAARPVERRWTFAGVERIPTDAGPLRVERHEVTDPAVGELAVVHLAGDVVLAAPGVELEDLDSPPTLTPAD